MEKLDLVRVLACKHVNIASRLSHNAKQGVDWHAWKPHRHSKDPKSYEKWYLAQACRREAAIWNTVACLAKGKPAWHHAPPGLAGSYMVEAASRLKRLRAFVARDPAAAASECAALVAEYESRAKAREARELAAK